MKCASDFRADAREALRGRWPLAVGTGLVATLLGGDMLGVNVLFSSAGNFRVQFSQENLQNLFNAGMGAGTLRILLPLLMGANILMLLWALVRFVLGGVVCLGYTRFNLNLIDGAPLRFDDLFSQLHRIGAGFCLRLLTGIFILLWSLLLVVPGIIAAFNYAMAPYLLLENPEMTVMEAISESKRMMYGHRWRLFCLRISFIGWDILDGLTLGIGGLWLGPYVNAAYSAFYRDLTGKSTGYSFDPTANYQPPQD